MEKILHAMAPSSCQYRCDRWCVHLDQKRRRQPHTTLTAPILCQPGSCSSLVARAISKQSRRTTQDDNREITVPHCLPHSCRCCSFQLSEELLQQSVVVLLPAALRRRCRCIALRFGFDCSKTSASTAKRRAKPRMRLHKLIQANLIICSRSLRLRRSLAFGLGRETVGEHLQGHRLGIAPPHVGTDVGKMWQHKDVSFLLWCNRG